MDVSVVRLVGQLFVAFGVVLFGITYLLMPRSQRKRGHGSGPSVFRQTLKSIQGLVVPTTILSLLLLALLFGLESMSERTVLTLLVFLACTAVWFLVQAARIQFDTVKRNRAGAAGVNSNRMI